MQDIATALKTAIKDWEIVKEINSERVEKWDGAIPTEKQPVAHRIFTYIKDNQGMNVAYYTDKLTEQGLIRGSVSSYIYQMLSTNLLRADENKKIYTAHTEYKTEKQLKPTPKKAKPLPKLKAKAKAKPTTVSVPKTVTLATPAPAVVRTVSVRQNPDTVNNDVERILSMLNVRTAHKLCEALNKIFKE